MRRAGLYATPLLAVLVVVETTDLLLATDSIPAVLAITLKPFIVYTSNVFAVLGLRSMYFRAGGHDGTLPLSALRAGCRFDLYRSEDAGFSITIRFQPASRWEWLRECCWFRVSASLLNPQSQER